MIQEAKHRWQALVARADWLLTVASLLAVAGGALLVWGFTVGFVLLQVLGAAIFGAGLSAFVGAVTGRAAVHQQSAREANLTRKTDTYGPLYAELKAVRSILSEAERGTGPAPLWIENGIEVRREGIPYIPLAAGPALPKFLLWTEFQRTYHDTDFKEATQSLLNKVQAHITTYNNAVETARQATIPILAVHLDAAITALQQQEDYKQWQVEDARLKANPPPVGHAPTTARDWYGYIHEVATVFAAARGVTPGRRLADEWLGMWPPNYPSKAPGWLVAGHADQAAYYVRRNYSSGMQYPPPPPDWIRDVFMAAWPDMQQATEFQAATTARETLFQRVQTATQTLEMGLRQIQQLYEGGEPRV